MGTGELASPLRPWPGPSGAAPLWELRRGRARTVENLEPLEMGAQTNSKETDPCPTLRDYSHSRVARDPRSGCLGAGWSPAGSPGAFLGASPGPAPPSGAGVPLLLLLGSARSMPPARARAARSPQCFRESRRAVKTRQDLVHRYITTPQHPAARPTSTNRSRVLRRPAMPSVQLS